MNILDHKETVARVLKPIWVFEGAVSSAAFNLRPQLRETYVSVLRENVESFLADLFKVSKDLHQKYGIFITINNQQLVGGMPFESLELKRGKSVDQVLLEIRKTLARFASKTVKEI